MHVTLILSTAGLLALGIGLTPRPGPSPASRAPQAGTSLSVMSFNLRYAQATGAHPWPERLPGVSAVIRAAAPQVIGTQEGQYRQLVELERALEDYEWIGLGREGGSHGEFMALFHDPRRLEPLEYDHFWLSESPLTMGSRSWDAACQRMLTWVRYRDIVAGTELVVANTHFDHVSAAAREASARLIAQKLGGLHPGLPLILCGDFNCAAGASTPYGILVDEGPFLDSWRTAAEAGPDCATFNNWSGPRPGPRIDWILTRGELGCLRTSIITEAPLEPFPSDHYPVLSVFELP